jgi:hypothetical protein
MIKLKINKTFIKLLEKNRNKINNDRIKKLY